MTAKNIKVRAIFDTNVWISFLIGKRLSTISKYISNRQVIIITTSQLIEEILETTRRKDLRKYFPYEKVLELVRFLEVIAEKYEITSQHFINRDPKDDFLLDLITASKADYLVTGDKDLLSLNPFETATILKPADFERILTDEKL